MSTAFSKRLTFAAGELYRILKSRLCSKRDGFGAKSAEKLLDLCGKKA